jgi:hypothetical protein
MNPVYTIYSRTARWVCQELLENVSGRLATEKRTNVQLKILDTKIGMKVCTLRERTLAQPEILTLYHAVEFPASEDLSEIWYAKEPDPTLYNPSCGVYASIPANAFRIPWIPATYRTRREFAGVIYEAE